MVNMSRFRSQSGFDIEQNPWFCIAFFDINYTIKTAMNGKYNTILMQL